MESSNKEQLIQRRKKRQELLVICRFLSLRTTHFLLAALLFLCGLLFSLEKDPQFPPYSIALFTIMVPFVLDAAIPEKEKKNSSSGLSVLADRCCYSPASAFHHRIAYYSCCVLLLLWHMLQKTPLEFCGISIPLLFLAIALAVYPVLSYLFYLLFHFRLMSGDL